jgi:hypothetical protein
MKIEFDLSQLRKRILQPTVDLMTEVGNVTPCGNGQSYAHRATGAPVLAVAHCDYRDCGSDHFFAQNGKVWSSRLDDRLGVYLILDVLPALGIHTDILLTDDEERGQSTAQYFAPDSHEYNWIFQFDRRGTDAVCYDYDCMEPHVKQHFKVSQGSFSDISMLEHLRVGGVNIGTAYYEEHSLGSYAIFAQIRQQVRKFCEFYHAFSGTHIPHVPREWQYLSGAGWERTSDTAHWFNDPNDKVVASLASCHELEWFDFSDNMYWAEGAFGDDFEITYHDDERPFPWRLEHSGFGGREWFKTLHEARECAHELFSETLLDEPR